MTNRTCFLLSCYCFLFSLTATLTQGSILKGFATKDVPSLEEIPSVASAFRQFGGKPELYYKKKISTNRRNERQPRAGTRTGRALKGDKKETSSKKVSKEKTSAKEVAKEVAKESANTSGEKKQNYTYPYTEESTPEFVQSRSGEVSEFSFVIVLDEFAYSTTEISIGTRFGFTGRLSTDEFLVGSSSGMCTIGSNVNTNFASCMFYLTFNSEGTSGSGTVALSGNTDEVGGYLQVTGTGGDLAGVNNGSANLLFDPTGVPIIYLMLRLQQ